MNIMKPPPRLTRILPLLAASLFGACASERMSPSTGEIDVALSAPHTQLELGAPVEITVTITNTSHDIIMMLVRDTPLEGIRGPIFTVTRAGESVPYRGRMIHWASPRADNYQSLAPGQTLTSTVDLSTAYDFSRPGSYEIHYEHRGSTDAVELQIAQARTAKPPEPGVAVEALTQNSCNGAQAEQITQSWEAARVLVAEVDAFLAQPPLDGPRYNQWFGRVSQRRWRKVRATYAEIAAGFDQPDVRCDCDEQDAYAYVYPDTPYQVWVCPAFWSAQDIVDSQAGTFVHELSHFAGTDDYAYGVDAAEELSPELAVKNADNYGYFAENPDGLGYAYE